MEKKDLYSYLIERVYVETTDHIINGDIYVPASCSGDRRLSEYLNTNRKFIVVKNCKVEYKNYNSIREIEKVDFMQINTNFILIIKHASEELL